VRRALALTALALSACGWELLPPTGYTEAGVLPDASVADDSTPATCGRSRQRCCETGLACQSGLGCFANMCGMVTCGGVAATCQPRSNTCCDGRACRDGITHVPLCCVGLGQACDRFVPHACCGELSCNDPGDGRPVCACNPSGGTCFDASDCCGGRACVGYHCM
jgi:hypothetical protein